MKGLTLWMLLAIILAAVSGSATAFGMPGTKASATPCWAPPEPDPTDTVSCFPPSRLAQLKRRMPSLIDPSVAVRRAVHLSLTDAVLLTRSGRPLLATLYYGDLRFSRPPFRPPASSSPSPVRYLGVDEYPDQRYRAHAHRLAVIHLPGGFVQVEGYVPARNLSFRISAAAPEVALCQVADAFAAGGSRSGRTARDFPLTIDPTPARFPARGV